MGLNARFGPEFVYRDYYGGLMCTKEYTMFQLEWQGGSCQCAVPVAVIRSPEFMSMVIMNPFDPLDSNGFSPNR